MPWGKAFKDPNRIRLWGEKAIWSGSSSKAQELVAHELGHVFNNVLKDAPGQWVERRSGWTCTEKEVSSGACDQQHVGLGVTKWSHPHIMYELWSDAFASWGLGKFADTPEGRAWKSDIADFMRTTITGWYLGLVGDAL